MKESGRTTIADVARLAGVDRAVVSKVLSEDPTLRVRVETRERVVAAADELRYRPNFHARGLARARAGAMGLLIPAGNPLMVPIIAGAEEVAAERGLLLWTASHEGELTRALPAAAAQRRRGRRARRGPASRLRRRRALRGFAGPDAAGEPPLRRRGALGHPR